MDTALPIQRPGPGLRFHAHQPAQYELLHERPFPVLPCPVRVSHIAVRTDGQHNAEHAALVALCQRYQVNPPVAHASCFYQSLGKFDVRWERHTEFSTLCFIRPGTESTPFERTALDLLPDDWLSQFPGEVMSASHFEVRLEQSIPGADALRDLFEGQRLIQSHAKQGQARLWTPFRRMSDGFNKVLIYDLGMSSNARGRLIRTLIELENYICASLKPVTMARRLFAKIEACDQTLAGLIRQMRPDQGPTNPRQQLDSLTDLSQSVEKMIADTCSRFSATRAYAAIVRERLEELEEQSVPGIPTLSEFLLRRLEPAWRSCEAVSQRLNDLSARIERASDLMRTRIDLAIQENNQGLLTAMNQRSRLQLRLQQTVEGLSVVAISYYILALTGLLMASWTGSSDRVISLLTLPVLFGVWAGARRFRKRLGLNKP
jgi:uncharacterized membrane-anchored protein